jgi:hypothetical protein
MVKFNLVLFSILVLACIVLTKRGQTATNKNKKNGSRNSEDDLSYFSDDSLEDSRNTQKKKPKDKAIPKKKQTNDIKNKTDETSINYEVESKLNERKLEETKQQGSSNQISFEHLENSVNNLNNLNQTIVEENQNFNNQSAVLETEKNSNEELENIKITQIHEHPTQDKIPENQNLSEGQSFDIKNQELNLNNLNEKNIEVKENQNVESISIEDLIPEEVKITENIKNENVKENQNVESVSIEDPIKEKITENIKNENVIENQNIIIGSNENSKLEHEKYVNYNNINQNKEHQYNSKVEDTSSNIAKPDKDEKLKDTEEKREDNISNTKNKPRNSRRKSTPTNSDSNSAKISNEVQTNINTTQTHNHSTETPSSYNTNNTTNFSEEKFQTEPKIPNPINRLSNISNYLESILISISKSHDKIKLLLPYPYDLISFILFGYLFAKFLSLFFGSSKI